MEKNMLLLLESLNEIYGYDFRQYARAHVRRRILHCLSMSQYKTVEDLHTAILSDQKAAALLLRELSVTVTEMFRDADFYKALRQEVIPVLKTYPFIKIWHAGCATGQEVYSMAIVLLEEGIYDRTTLYATDFNENALRIAREGIYNKKDIDIYEASYAKAGGKADLSTYFTSSVEHGIIASALKKNIVWANHNLVTDHAFAEMNLIICRNVLIYFDRHLQDRVHQLFLDSLVRWGILCLGSKESLKFTAVANQYVPVNEKQRIFKKIVRAHE